MAEESRKPCNMGNPIAETWIYATILIENPTGGKGTGFLVYREMSPEQGRVFLATNKHVMGDTPEHRTKADWVVLHLNMKGEDGRLHEQAGKLLLNLPDGSKVWREHPDPDVDVLAIDVTGLIANYPQIEKRWANYSLFANKELLEKEDVTIGDDVMVVGYPLGLKHAQTSFPLVRAGIIATRIGEVLEDEFREPGGGKRKRSLRGFLIDGATIPGSSGSPVVLKPVIGRKVKNSIIMGIPVPILLGIVAETKYAPIHTEIGDFLSFAGLGFAFDAETVRETIEMFFK